MAARLFMTCSIVSSFAVLTFCGKTAILNVLPKRWVELKDTRSTSDPLNNEQNARNNENFNNRRNTIVYYTLTLLWLFTSVAIGVFVPDISSVIGIIGNLAAAFIFIFPGWLSFKSYCARMV